ncbi:hypothetical protein EU528_04735 [Candidatus Thorarchaeota archaeon]|nr:MAG: hypothetical protein EU528_04735 [Candidatus Thorarchaeota archaeon]
MIRLIGVLTHGGVPIKVKSSMDAEGELILGPLIEAAKALSHVMGSGEVRKLGFQDNTLIVTESKKGYTIVALVSKAEGYMDSLLRVISDAIDESDIALADGAVNDNHIVIIEDIVGTYVRDHIETGFPETLEMVWEPIVKTMRQDSKLSVTVNEVEALLERSELTEKWSEFKAEISGSLEDALDCALQGEFDRACAIAMTIDSALAGVFAIKMGALTHSMTKLVSPALAELIDVATQLSDDYPFADMARTLVGYITGANIPADYARAFREAIRRFEFKNDTEHLLLGFLFLDARVTDFPDFAANLVKLYREKSEIVCSFIEAMNERGKLFEKVYSITSYDGFRDELGVYKSNITSILGSINWVMDSDLLWELKKEGKGIEIGITASLKLQNYIAVLTALAESPVLTIGERREILEEVLMLYKDYFRGLMKSDIPLFAYTLDSVFQSMSVAQAEYYFLVTGEIRDQHMDQSIEFVSDIFAVIDEEWPKSRVRFSLFVVANALCPVLTRAKTMPEVGIRTVYLAMRLLDINTVDASQITKPETYATYFGNTISTLTSIASQLLEGDERNKVLKRCVEVILDIQEWFVSKGVICRDDIITASFHSTLVLNILDDSELEKVTNKIIALNRITVQDTKKYDYEVAMMASPFIEVLIYAWKKLDSDIYLKLARATFDTAYTAWIKYGFHEKAENFKKKYGEVWS